MLVIDDLTVRIAGRTLLEGASARISAGARVGLVGRNGTGKSTLFNVIAGDISAPIHGTSSMPPRWRIGRLAQEAPNGPESLLEVVLKADRERTALLDEAETAHDPASHRRDPDPARRHRRACGAGARGLDPGGPGLFHRRPGAALLRILRRLAHARRARRRLCSPSPTCCCSTSRPTISISKARCGCRIIWRRYPRTMIIISHDRDLLDNAVNQILSLERKKLTLYRGGYYAISNACAASAWCSTRR